MVMKRADLIRKINKAAANAGIDFIVVREEQALDLPMRFAAHLCPPT